jgi:glucose/arabinose dehydrogenase
MWSAMLPGRGKLLLVTVLLLGLTVGIARQSQVTTADMGRSEEGAGFDTYLPVVSRELGHPENLVLVPFATGFDTDSVTAIVNAGDSRLFVVLQEGMIMVVQANGTVLPTPFLDIRDQVTLTNWEEGMLGLVFHPNFPAQPYFFVSYTSVLEHRIHIVRYTVNPANPNVADPNSATLLMAISKSVYNNMPSPVHNGGDMHFGPDGYLYIGIGDGGPDPYEVPYGTPGDPFNNAQRRHVLLGKILRINVDPGAGLPADCGGTNNYSIPPDNPFADGVGGSYCDEIWARGLRNPWRFSFDSLTGDLFISDVGEWRREEINFEPAGSPGGLNYGWHCWEGFVNYATLPEWDPAQWPFTECGPAEWYTFPIHEYNDDDCPIACAVTGGYVYRGSQFPQLYGHYVYAEFFNRLWLLYQGNNGNWIRLTMSNPGLNISTFGVGADGELYAGTWSPGGPNAIYRIVVP